MTAPISPRLAALLTPEQQALRVARLSERDPQLKAAWHRVLREHLQHSMQSPTAADLTVGFRDYDHFCEVMGPPKQGTPADEMLKRVKGQPHGAFNSFWRSNTCPVLRKQQLIGRQAVQRAYIEAKSVPAYMTRLKRTEKPAAGPKPPKAPAPKPAKPISKREQARLAMAAKKAINKFDLLMADLNNAKAVDDQQVRLLEQELLEHELLHFVPTLEKFN